MKVVEGEDKRLTAYTLFAPMTIDKRNYEMVANSDNYQKNL